MPLTEVKIRTAKIQAKPYKIYDDRGMYVLVNKSGKYFRLDYRIHNNRKTLALGVYPEVKLAEARESRDEARKLIKQGIDPVQHRKKLKELNIRETENTFENIALEWFNKQSSGWSKNHTPKVFGILKNKLFPGIGKKPIESIKRQELISILTAIEDLGTIDTAHRTCQIINRIFNYAILSDRAEKNPALELSKILKPKSTKNMATITDPKKIGELLRAIDGFSGEATTVIALQLAPHFFVRPGELRHAEWNEFNFEENFWKIPAEKMKMRETHLVPLSTQTKALLLKLHPLTGGEKYLFPSTRTKDRPISDNTLNGALRRLGFRKDEIVVHGFRAMASTLLHEQGFEPEVIERQLAHSERNRVKAAYNHAQHLSKRIEMMQRWSDYLEGLKGLK